jgi:hypothetical protein
MSISGNPLPTIHEISFPIISFYISVLGNLSFGLRCHCSAQQRIRSAVQQRQQQQRIRRKEHNCPNVPRTNPSSEASGERQCQPGLNHMDCSRTGVHCPARDICRSPTYLHSPPSQLPRTNCRLHPTGCRVQRTSSPQHGRKLQ